MYFDEIGIPTRQVSAENPRGEKGGACAWTPDPTNPDLPFSDKSMRLGKGWKVRPFIRLEPHQTVTLMDVEGSGSIRECFITTDYARLSELVIRMYRDDEASPSVECPLGAFFAMGHDNAHHAVISLPVHVVPRAGMNCYWRMPFCRRARITLTHEGEGRFWLVAYRILYKLHPVADGTATFHAQYRRAVSTTEHPVHTVLDGVRGCGAYVGTYLAWTALQSDWWGEGEVKFFLDGDAEQPTLADNGTEDYFGGSFGFSPFNSDLCWNAEQPFCGPYLGMPLALTHPENGPRLFSLYRWHMEDSIGFEKDIRVEVQTLGMRDGRYRPLSEDIASVAYWYQQEPHVCFPLLPPAEVRLPR